MEDRYTTFRILGYKINEISDNKFIVQRPDGKLSLFDSECNLIKGKLSLIRQLTDTVYGGVDGRDAIVFDAHGKVLDIEYADSSVDNPLSDNVHVGYNCIKVIKSRNNKYNIYSLDGQASFKGIEGRVFGVVYNNGKYMLINNERGREGHYEPLKLIDAEGNKKTLSISSEGLIGTNNHYLHTQNSKGEETIIDFEGNVICSGDNLVICDSTLDNDTIVYIEGYYLNIKAPKQNIDIRYRCKYAVREVECTSNKELLRVTDIEGDYILNIRTQKATRHYRHILFVHENIMIVIEENTSITVYRLNVEDSSVEKFASADSYLLGCEYLTLIDNKGQRTYYDKDLKQLIHEF